jgi:hypothetical protein
VPVEYRIASGETLESIKFQNPLQLVDFDCERLPNLETLPKFRIPVWYAVITRQGLLVVCIKFSTSL